MKFTDDEILSRPLSLLVSKVTLENRIKVLEECCFNVLEFSVLMRFIFVLNRTVKELKVSDYISSDIKVHQRLPKLLDIDIQLPQNVGDNSTLKSIRQIIIDTYLKEKLGMTDVQIAKQRKVYFQIVHRNLRSIVAVLKILQTQLSFTNKQIIDNGFLLTASPENIQELLTDVESIGGVSMKELIRRRPKLVMINKKKIKEIISHVKSFDIREEKILNAIDMLSLHPGTVHDRLDELSRTEDFNILRSHDKFLRLVLYHSKAKLRFEYLKLLKRQCASMHVLTGSSDQFERHTLMGNDKSRDIIEFIASIFNLKRWFVNEVLNRHPNWQRVPLTTVRTSIEFLRGKEFSDETIIENLYLLLYPLSRIEPKLKSLLEKRSKGAEFAKLSNRKLLQLCLYQIEIEFNMSGEGVFESSPHGTERDLSTELIHEPVSRYVKALSRGNRYGEPRNSILNRH